MARVTTGWTEIGTFGTRLDVEVGLNETFFRDGDDSVQERY